MDDGGTMRDRTGQGHVKGAGEGGGELPYSATVPGDCGLQWAWTIERDELVRVSCLSAGLGAGSADQVGTSW